MMELLTVMYSLFIYLLKFSLGLSAVGLLYLLFLRRLTFYQWNRYYLLFYPMLCFLLPLVDIGWLVENPAEAGVLHYLPAMAAWPERTMVTETSSFHWNDLAGIVMVSGTGLMMVRTLVQYVSLLRMHRRANLLVDGAVRLYEVKESIIPFSFGGAVYINPLQHRQEDLKDIIRHEMVHVRQHHTVDIIFSELLVMVNWFNPFAWLIRNAIRQNLEFIADRHLLDSGLDRRQYQYLLLKVVGQQQFSLASHLNFSALKTRIAMMNKIRSARVHLVKFAFALPLAAVLLLAFRKHQEVEPANAQIIKGPKNENLDHPVLMGQSADHSARIPSDTIPGKQETFSYYFGPNAKGFRFHIQGGKGMAMVSILDKSGKLLKSVPMSEWEKNAKEFQEKYGELPPPPPPAPAPPPPPAEPLPGVNATAAPLASSALPAGSPAPVAPVAPVSPGAPVAPVAPIAPVAPVKKSDQALGISKNGQPGSDVLYLVDGREWSASDVQLIDPAKILEVNVWKGESAVKKFGAKAENGIVEITTKKEAGKKLIVEGETPLNTIWLVDGKEVAKEEASAIKPEQIANIHVLKGEAAVNRYGEKAKDGVIDIRLKKSN